MSTESIRNSVVGNSSVGIPEGTYALVHDHLTLSPKRKLDAEDNEEERLAKRMRMGEGPTPLTMGTEHLVQVPEATHGIASPVVASLAPHDQRWLSAPTFAVPDYTSPLGQMTPWIPTPTTAVPLNLPQVWGAESFYSPFSLIPSWGDSALSNGMSHQLYQRQLQNTIQVLSPGASIAPLLAPVMTEDNTPKKSPLLEPENHKFYDPPALLQKLSLSKSPVLEAVIYCALNKWGIEMLPFGPDKKLCFRVTDFDKFSVYSAKINSKGKPTTDVSSRVKALRRWFDGIPKVKDRKIAFVMSVKGSEDKHSKVTQLVDKVTAVYQSRLAAVHNPELNGGVQD